MQTVCMKDSLEMTDIEREKIFVACKESSEQQIVITHGTDTMPETAKYLGARIHDKAIVLLGAITPYNQPSSDSMFNLGSALTAVGILPVGVYIAMNGRIFLWDNVQKNRPAEIFETLS